MHSIGEWWMWLAFFIIVLGMLAVDMFLLGGQKAHRVSTKEALSWSIVWLLIALGFNCLLWLYLKHQYGLELANQKSLEFFTGYLIEKALSVENIFVFVMLFTYFAVPTEYQRRVLLYGVLGAIVMRLILILLGIWIINQFSWILYFFGVFLIITAFKMLLVADEKLDLSKNLALRWMKNHLRITETYHEEKFFVKINNQRYITPLFIVLVLIEISDLIFAVDSVPTIFAITSDPFIVLTSNIFAILGLRALYFLLANIVDRFYLLKYGLAIILIFIGVKMLIADWFKISILVTLAVIVALLASSILLSLYKTKKA